MNKLAERLQEERARTGLNQTDFGALGQVQKRAQFTYEKGERVPDANYLMAIAESGVDVQYLLTGKRTITEEKINEELRYLADAYEAIDTALLETNRTLEPRKKRLAAEALYKAFKGGEIQDLGRGANLLLSAA